MKSIKLSDYFEIRKTKYTYLKITSHKSIRNYNSSNIGRLMALSFKSINKRLYREKKKFIFECDFKFSYVIDIKNNNANFYFIVPTFIKNQILQKLNEIWSHATIEEVEGIEDFSSSSFYYDLYTFKEDALSLAVDKKANTLLNSTLATMDVIKESDRITMISNFMPRGQFGWDSTYEETMQKIKAKKPLEKMSLSASYLFKNGIVGLVGLLDKVAEVLCDFTGSNIDKTKESLYSSILGVLEEQKGLSTNTKKKREALVLPTQMMVVSNNEDLARATCVSYKSLDEDNEILFKRVLKKKFNIENYNFCTSVSTLSTDEVSEFIKIPGRQLCLQHKLSHIETTESNIPKELREGSICLGESVIKGNKSKVYLSSDKNLKNLCLCVIGATRGGKTTFLSNLSKNCIDNNECVDRKSVV